MNKRKKFIILPTIPFGVNTGQKDILLNINMNPSTQHKILSDIIRVLNRQGINKLLVFNGHGGNSFTTILREIGMDYLICFYYLQTGSNPSIRGIILKMMVIMPMKWRQV